MELFKLNNENIDMISEKIGDMYKEAGCTKKETFRAKLLLEEALLKYQSRFDSDIEFYFRKYKIFGEFRFCVRIRSAAFDPFTLEENPMAFMIQSIITTFENGMPTWKYRNLENEILFSVKKKSSVGSLTKIAIAIGVSAVLGVISRLFIAQKLLKFIAENYINPLTDAYAGLFCVMAVLLTFFAIVLSVVHIGDMASVGALGGRIMKRFFAFSAISLIVLTLPLIPFINLSGIGEYKSAAKSVYDILVGFIPTNIVSPFLNFNPVHIMIVGAMFGFSLLSMGQKGSTIVQTFDECNLVAVYTNNFLNKFIAFYVALKIWALITTSDFNKLKSAGKMIIFVVIAIALLMLFYAVYTSIKAKMPIAKFFKYALPGFLVCLSSANFGAAFSTIFDSMVDGGVDTDTVSISINLGSVFFRPASTVAFAVSSIFMAKYYNVEISIIWLVMALLLSLIFASSMPNIPGAAVSVLTLLYAQLGIPAEALSLMIAVSAVLQFLTVAADTFCLESEIFCINASKQA